METLDFIFKNGKNKLEVKLRFDKYYSITADLYEGIREVAGGCLHEDILEYLNNKETIIYKGKKIIDNNDKFKEMISLMIEMHLNYLNGEPMYCENLVYNIYNNKDYSSYCIDEIDKETKYYLDKLYFIIYEIKYKFYDYYQPELSTTEYYKRLYKSELYKLGFPIKLYDKSNRLKDLLEEFGINIERNTYVLDFELMNYKDNESRKRYIDLLYKENIEHNNNNLIHKDLEQLISYDKRLIEETTKRMNLYKFIFKLNPTIFYANKYDISILNNELKIPEGKFSYKEMREIKKYCDINKINLTINKEQC